jgi:hypothetical protein
VSDSSGQWLKGCALGCGGLVVFFVLALVGMSVSMRTAFDDAHEDRQILVEQFGENDVYTPVVDGSVPEDRVAAFLMVREALAEVHSEIEGVDGEMADFETMVEGEEPALRETLPAVFRMTKAMMGLPWIFGKIERTRNRALVEAEMGLGEYSYIYTVAYHDQMLSDKSDANLFTASVANSRVRTELRGMIERQLAAARTDGADEEMIAVLSAEWDALERDDRRIPWQDGLPEQISVSFVAERARLDATYSAASAEFELLNSTIRGGGMSIQMD